MSFLQEFKTFAMRGSMVDLAIGVIIGAAFGKIVSSLVADILMPPIGMILGGVDFSNLVITLKAAADGQPAVLIKYGLFINTIIDFVIISFVIFGVVTVMNRLRGEQPVPAAATKECPQCMMAIPAGAKRCGHCCSAF